MCAYGWLFLALPSLAAAGLDSRAFHVRERAAAALRSCGTGSEQVLWSLRSYPSAEVQRRVFAMLSERGGYRAACERRARRMRPLPPADWGVLRVDCCMTAHEAAEEACRKDGIQTGAPQWHEFRHATELRLVEELMVGNDARVMHLLAALTTLELKARDKLRD